MHKNSLSNLGPFQKISIMYIFYIITILIFSYIYCFIFIKDYTIDIGYFYDTLVNKWDVNHYLKIAENGYVTTGNDKYAIVFFPLYPLSIRILHLLSGFSYKLSASIISLTCGFASLFMLYKLARIDYNEKVSLNVVKYYILYPFSFFILTRMSESLFLLLLFSTIYFVRKKKYLTAGILGYLTSLTRLLGLGVGIIMLVEFIILIFTKVKNKDFHSIMLLKPLLMMLVTLSGFLTYLGINYKLFGNAFKFMEFQSEVWSQNFSNPFRTLSVIIFKQILDKTDPGFSLGVGVTNLFVYLLILLVFLYSLKKLRLSYALYTLIYFYVSFSASWLLSGARYSLGLFTIYLSLGTLCRDRKGLNILLTTLSVILSMSAIILYNWSYIY